MMKLSPLSETTQKGILSGIANAVATSNGPINFAQESAFKEPAPERKPLPFANASI